MAVTKTRRGYRPREPRREVLLAARMRTGAQWSDANILNISSKGLMIHSGLAGPEGSRVELRRGRHVILATVVWSDGGRVGLRSDERLPVDEILSLGRSRPLPAFARDGSLIERRQTPRTADLGSLRARASQFLSACAVAVCISLSIWSIAQHAFAGR